MAREVPVGVISEIDNGSFVSGGLVVNRQFVVGGERISNFAFKIAGVTLFAILAEITELEFGFTALGLCFFDFPDNLVEALNSAVQGIVAVVGCQLVFFAVEREFCSSDSVAISSYDCAK